MKSWNVFMLLVQWLAAGACAWSCFCRMVRTNGETAREIRWAIWFQFVVCGLLVGAPVLPLLVPELAHAWRPWTTPRWIFLLAVVAMAVMQLVTARYWRDGVPDDFQRPRRVGASAYLTVGVVVALVLSWGAAVPAPAAAAPMEREDAQAEPNFTQLAPGESGTCRAPDGCIVMSTGTFRRLLRIAERGIRGGTTL